MINLKDKKVLITGATGGIGGSLVKKFLSEIFRGGVIYTYATSQTQKEIDFPQGGVFFTIISYIFDSSTY